MNIRQSADAIKDAAARYINAVFPEDIYCISCGKNLMPGALYSMCSECISGMNWANGRVCSICGKLLEEWYPVSVCGECQNKIHSFDDGLTCFRYSSLEREMLHDFKYHGRSYMARQFSRILYDKIEAENRHCDIFVPVPMYRNKERRRGYNQADLIARYTASLAGAAYDGEVLVRIRETAPMNRLTARERRHNLDGAFIVNEEKIEIIRGKHVMLVDDIYTTGTTMEQCSTVLKRAGAKHVTAVTIAAGRNQRELPYLES